MFDSRHITIAAIFFPILALGFDYGWVNPPDTADQIRSYGYPAETHYVTTADGYVLKLFRIPHGKENTPTHKPLLLLHGVLCTSDCWTLTGPDHGLAFVLADRGYDVWLGNNRGSTYSLSHMTIPSDDPTYWDFGIHEMGVYDLPAMVDYILEKTDERSISYVGHSQGTTLFFIMTSMLPEYQSKIRVATALAPIAYLDHTRGLVKTLSLLSRILVWLTRSAGYSSLMHNHIYIRLLGEIVCKDDFFLGNICKIIFSQIGGTDHLINDTLSSQVTLYCPAGASVKQMQHFTQLTQNGGEFTQFDYGPVENLLKYGSIMPPSYPLENIQTPVLLYYSTDDNFATKPEILRLKRNLKNVRSVVELMDFNHLDFMWGLNATTLLYRPAINEMVIFR